MLLNTWYVVLWVKKPTDDESWTKLFKIEGAMNELDAETRARMAAKKKGFMVGETHLTSKLKQAAFERAQNPKKAVRRPQKTTKLRKMYEYR